MPSDERMNQTKLQMIPFVLILFCITSCTVGCSPGGGRQPRGRAPPVSTPLKLKQRVPDVSETTIGASGKPEGRIERESERFTKLLSPNMNSDIQFKDEEGTGADRLMTQRCKDKLNTLAIAVMNEWPGEKLRVIEAWDEDGHHEEDSLHYEGRAVDITTSERTRSKYGALARMAVDAGFDWVLYESRNYVHCSVKADSSAQDGGCFNFKSTVRLKNGNQKLMEDLQVGDEVMVVENDGKIGFSKVILLMDRQIANKFFYTIHTDQNKNITLTPEHLIYASETNSSFTEKKTIFASDIKVGDYLFVKRDFENIEQNTLIPAKVTSVSMEWHEGAVAPLTYQGTIVVNDCAASSYAVIEDEWIAHSVFAPVRWYHNIRQYYGEEVTEDPSKASLHWYPRLLYKFGSYLVSKRLHTDFTLPE